MLNLEGSAACLVKTLGSQAAPSFLRFVCLLLLTLPRSSQLWEQTQTCFLGLGIEYWNTLDKHHRIEPFTHKILKSVFIL